MTAPLAAIWRTVVSSYLALVLILVVFQLVAFATHSNAQNFDPKLPDKVYLNNIEKEIRNELNQTRVSFWKQAQLLDTIARQFVAAQIKENLFIALRILAERELSQTRGNNSDLEESTVRPGFSWLFLDSLNEKEAVTTVASNVSTSTVASEITPTTLRSYTRKKRQDDGDDGDEGDGDGGAGAAGAGIPNRPTIPPQIGLLPQVANLVRVIFGGNGNVNFTSYVQSASKLLPRPVGNQVLGLVKILTNANGNNRNSFTTPNPLLAGNVKGQLGQLPANLNLKSPAFAGLTQEQLLALGLPPNAEGLTPEAINNLAGLAGISGAAGIPGVGVPGAGQTGGAGAGAAGAGGGAGAVALPGGLTPQDIAYLAALGIPDLPNIGTTAAPAPRSTRKPRPSYSPHNKNRNRSTPPPAAAQVNEQSFAGGPSGSPSYGQPPFNEQSFGIAPTGPPSFHEQPFVAPTYPPNYLNGPPVYAQQNPQFVGADKDILPLNLNPNKQTISELQQSLQQQLQQGPKYQETPQSAAQPSYFAPEGGNFQPTNNNFPSANNNFSPASNNFPPNNYQPGSNNNNFSPVNNNGNYAPAPGSQDTVTANQANQQQQQIDFYKHPSNAGGTFGQQNPNEQDTNPNPAISSNQPQKLSGPSGGKNRRPQTPFQQQQAQLLEQQLQQLQVLEQQGPPSKPERPQPSEPQFQTTQAQRPQQFQQQAQYQQQPQSQFNQPPQGQFNQPPQGQFNQQPQNQFNQQPQGQFNQPPQGQFNQPPQGQFNQPAKGQFNQPPQGQFNQQPQGQFNQPPQGQFSQPTAGQFNQPPKGQFGEPGQGQFAKPPKGQFTPGQQGQGQFPQNQNPNFQQRPQPQFNQQRPISTLQQQNQLQQKFQQQVFQRPPPNNVDEDESEEADTDYDSDAGGRRTKRQLTILQNLLPSLFGQNNNNNNNNNINNNNNGQQNNNNNNNVNGNTTASPVNNVNGNNNNNNGNGNNNGAGNNNNNNNNNFDLSMFAQNLSRGMSEVARIMPDLFRGAREGLQLIQALSGILRAFPGLADAIPIPI